MPLSDQLSAALTNAFIRNTRIIQHRRLSFEVGGTWYCPGCGMRVIEDDGSITCAECGQSLNDFIFPLIELHPHKESH